MNQKPPVKSYCGGKPNYCEPNEKTFSDAEAFAQELKKEAAIQYIMEFYGIDRHACMKLYMDEVKAYMELSND